MTDATTVEGAEALVPGGGEPALAGEVFHGPRSGVASGKLAVWLFLASEVMFFAGIIGSYVVLRVGADSWPDPTKTLNIPLTALNTFVLICSSVTMVKALSAAHRDDQSGIRNYLAATVGFGLFFLSVQAYEYGHLFHGGLTPWGSLFGSCFYTMTGFHGLHVTGGVVWIICILVQALRGKYGRHNHVSIEYAGLYWHFVDLVWIILFTIVYLF